MTGSGEAWRDPGKRRGKGRIVGVQERGQGGGSQAGVQVRGELQ